MHRRFSTKIQDSKVDIYEPIEKGEWPGAQEESKFHA